MNVDKSGCKSCFATIYYTIVVILYKIHVAQLLQDSCKAVLAYMSKYKYPTVAQKVSISCVKSAAVM